MDAELASCNVSTDKFQDLGKKSNPMALLGLEPSGQAPGDRPLTCCQAA